MTFHLIYSCTQEMPTDLHSNISKISLGLPLSVFIFTVRTRKSTLNRWCSHWMTVWLGLNLILVFMGKTSSCWKVPLSFKILIHQNFSSFDKFKWDKILWLMLFLLSTWYGNREQYFYQDTICGNCWPRLKSNSPANKMEAIPTKYQIGISRDLQGETVNTNRSCYMNLITAIFIEQGIVKTGSNS